jgi:pimeloyl-ACP methyl ester carboxylesterase
MQQQTPYFREIGVGTSVVCLHSSASSSGQWQALMERLTSRFRVIAVDLYGSGNTVPWPGDHPFQAAGDRFHLVGHSFGGAVVGGIYP